MQVKILKHNEYPTSRSNITQSSIEILNVESPHFFPSTHPTSEGITHQNMYVNHPTSEGTTHLNMYARHPNDPYQRSMYTASETSRNMPYSTISNHRLPKISLPTFNGSILDWHTFWDSYESAVHFNPTLTNVEKFNYLKSQLQGEALYTIPGFSPTNGNYMEAIIVVKERYRQLHKIADAYLQHC